MNSKTHDITSSELDALMRLDLMTFIHRCFVELNPTLTMSEAPHLRVLAAKLADTLLGRETGALRFISSRNDGEWGIRMGDSTIWVFSRGRYRTNKTHISASFRPKKFYF